MENQNRRHFLRTATLGLVAAPLITSAQTERPPALAPELVKDFVIAGHGNLAKVKDMLAVNPSLLNACWDWGGGDFETALEGAGHVGSRDVAEFLIANGARMNIFVAAMLGRIEIVRSTLTAFPNLKQSKGPHGLDLLHHARKGGDQAKAVLDFLLLETKG